MILGIGVDTVEINRFSDWHTYSKKKLQRIFSEEEIKYCLSQKNKSAERFAARFAAREAFYKALSYAYPDQKIPFLRMCKAITIKKINNKPYIIMEEQLKIALFKDIRVHLSLSHSDIQATAFVIIEI